MDDFDIGAAVDSIGADLGFGGSSDASTDTSIDTSDTSSSKSSGDVNFEVSTDTGAGTAAVADKTNTPAVKTEAEQAADTTQQVQNAADNAAPRTWRAEAAAAWATLPPVAQQEILKREQDMWNGLEGYKADAAYGKSFKQVIQPYEGILQQHGLDPVQQVTGLMNAHFTLATGTQDQKIALFHKLASDYGVDLLSAATIVPPYVDPEVAALQKEVEQLKSTQSAQQAAVVKDVRVKIESEIDAFAADPSNVYFGEVVDDIAAIINSGRARTLKEAYDAAIWMNPAVRAKELTRQQAEKDAEAAKKRQEQTANARKALSVNVKASAKSGSAAAPLGSIDDTLNETLAAIRGRV